jgi:tetratricopeptide (TPR) repeat protein
MATNLMKYNPAFLGDEALIRSFVARTSELERILEVLQENTTGANQHLLVLGPRGIGKTTLVLRTAAEIRADPDLGARWYPIVYGEETYQVSSAGELWLEALFHVGQQTEDERWQQAYNELLGERNEERLRARALAQLMDFADAQGKRLVLVVENLNMLFGGQIGEQDAWVLRKTLMNEQRIMLIGTATSRFSVMDEYNQALYELFRIIELDPLADEEVQAVWTEAAGQTAPRHQLRPIQILTGGNPRLIRILSEFAAKTSFRSLMEDLTRLVDEHTEYFKHHLDNLPPQERKVFVVLADLWDPSTARQIAEAARLDVNVASAQLKRLIDRGAVTTPYKQGRTHFYQVAERMYNIYHLMRRRGQPSSRVHAVVRFMISLYHDEQLIKTTQLLAEEAIQLSAEERREHFHVYEALLALTREPSISEQLVDVGRLAFRALPDTPVSILQLLDPPDSRKVTAIAPGRAEYHDPAVLTPGSYITNAKDWLTAGTDRALADALFEEMLRTNSANEERWFRLGWYYAHTTDQKQSALQAFERVLALNPDDANAWANKGTALLELGHFEEALAAYERALSIDPTNRGALKGKARALIDVGRTEEAVVFFERLRAIIPDDAQLLTAIGSTMAELGRTGEAIEVLEQALALEPESFAGWYNMGTIFVDLGRYPEALEAYERALRLDARDLATWFNKGTVLLQLHDMEGALAAFQHALLLDPKNASAYHNSGVALHRLRRDEEALHAYDQALRLDPNNAATWFNRGTTLYDLDRPAEAVGAFDRSISLQPEDPATWLNRGAALGRVGQMLESLESYERAIAVDPTFAAAWTGKGAALGELGRVDEALKSLRHAVFLDVQNPNTWANLGSTLGRLGRPDEALEAYDRALELAPDATPAWIGRAVALENLGRTKEAIEAYRSALSHDAHNWDLWLRLAGALTENGHLEQALEAYDHALQLNPTHVAAWVGRGDSLRQLERAVEAVESYDRALEMEADRAGAWAGRGLSLLAIGRASEALESFQHCLALTPESATAFLGRGLAQCELGKLREAANDLEHAIHLGNLSRSTEFIIVRLFLEDLEQPEVAVSAAQALTARVGTEPETLNGLAWVFYRFGRKVDLSRAEAWARTAVDQLPGSGSARHTLACILGAQGRWEQALSEAEVFLRDRELIGSALDEIIDFLIDATAAGQGDEVARIVHTSGAQDVLEPLIVAIRRRSGEQVEIAREIMEVSTDVIERIERRRRESQGVDRSVASDT